MLRLSSSPAPLRHSPTATQTSPKVSPPAQRSVPSQANTAFLQVSIHIEQHQFAGSAKVGSAETASFFIRPAFHATNLTGLPVRLHLESASLYLPASPTLQVQHGASQDTAMPGQAGPFILQAGPQDSSATVQLPEKQPVPINALWLSQPLQAGGHRPAGRSTTVGGGPSPAGQPLQTAAHIPHVRIEVMTDGQWTPAEPCSSLKPPFHSALPAGQGQQTPTAMARQPLSLPLMQANGARCLWLNTEAQLQPQPAKTGVVSQTLLCSRLTSGGGTHIVLYKDPQPPLVLTNKADVPLEVQVKAASAVTDAAAVDALSPGQREAGDAHIRQPMLGSKLAGQEAQHSVAGLTLQPGGSIHCRMDAWGFKQSAPSTSRLTGQLINGEDALMTLFASVWQPSGDARHQVKDLKIL